MLELKEIRIKNLGVFENETFQFKKGLNILTGINLDKSEESLRNNSIEQLLQINNNNLASNGSGKSLIEESITLCLFGIVIRPKITIRELITEGKDSCEIELICRNRFLNLSQISIKRTFFYNKNKTSKIEIFETNKEGEEKEIKYNIAGGLDKYILEHYIGISKENLLNYFILNETRYTPFLSLSDSKKKELLSNLMGLDKYAYAEEKISNDINDISEKIEKVKDNKLVLKGKESVYNDWLNALPSLESFNKEKKEQIDKLKVKILSFETEKQKIKNSEEELTSHKMKKSENLLKYWKETKKQKIENIIENNKYKDQLENLEKEAIDIKNQIKDIEDSIEGADLDLEKATTLSIKNLTSYEKIKKILSSLIKCPKCGYEFDASSAKGRDFYKEELLKKEKEVTLSKKEKEQIKQDIKEIKEYLEQIRKEENKNRTKIQETKRQIARVNRLASILHNNIQIVEASLESSKEQKSLLNAKIETIEEQQEQFKNRIELLEKEDYEKKYSKEKEEHLENIKNIKDSFKKLDNEEKEYRDKYNKVANSSLILKKYKDFLFNTYIQSIENLCNSYLSQLTNLNIKILTKKSLVSGKESDEINVKVLRDNREINFWVLSSGEKELINLSFILTFQTYINMSTDNGLSLICLDEITSHIDSYLQNIVEDFLNKSGKNIIFVSHVPAKNVNMKQTYIVKKNNRSKIVEI